MTSINSQLKKMRSRLLELKKILNLPKLKSESLELTQKSQQPDFWQQPEKAKIIMQKLSTVNQEIENFENLINQTNDLLSLTKNASVKEQQALKKDVLSLNKKIKKLEFRKYLSGPYDSHEAIISIHAGQGGTEAQDWTAMLKRMYLRYAEKKSWPTEIIFETIGEEAGIKSISFSVHGRYAYGYLKKEKGTHRLVRLSPFNADHLRQTSFALVEVMPLLDDNVQLNLKDEDIQFDSFRSSGKGGQNVNKVSTAVRLKHLPTGITVECQTQRSQEQNRKLALNLLKAKLWQKEEEQKQKQLEKIKGEHQMASWGNQIRSYVLHPYKQVKDLRTGHTQSDPQTVLDGHLQGFIKAQLKLA